MSRSPETARLFVALDPPEEVCVRLTAWARSVAAVGGAPRSAKRSGRPMRVLEAPSLHVTLCFLGGRPPEEIDALAEALATCAEPVGELFVGVPLWLPPRRPRALAVEIGGDERLAGLQRSVTRALADVSGWVPERRRFRAHLTVARVRDGFPTAAVALPATPRLSFTPEALVLYRSLLAPAGAEYEAIATRDLEPSPRPPEGGSGSQSWSSASPSEGG